MAGAAMRPAPARYTLVMPAAARCTFTNFSRLDGSMAAATGSPHRCGIAVPLESQASLSTTCIARTDRTDGGNA